MGRATPAATRALALPLALMAAFALVSKASAASAVPPASAGAARSADAKPSRTAPKAEAPGRWRSELQGVDDEPAVAAARALGESGAATAVAPLVELLAVGGRRPVTLAAMEALGALGDAGGAEALALYAGHRDVEVRTRAVTALGRLRRAREARAGARTGREAADGQVVATLIERVGDAAPEVRAAACEALAARGEAKAAPRLLALLAAGDAGAAAPLGTLAPADMLPGLVSLRGAVADGPLATALGEMVKRSDLADTVRVDVVRALGAIPGADATTALVEYLASVPARETRRSRKEAEALIEERSRQR